jgi:hypothetical protein
MNETEHAIHQALCELAEAARPCPPGEARPDLMGLFNRIDTLTRQLPQRTDPDLLHYLHRKSYEKARLWLEDRKTDHRRGQRL